MLRSSRTIALEEQLGLAAHRRAQVVVEVGEALAVGRRRLERAELQPLAAEFLDERLRPSGPAACAGPAAEHARAARSVPRRRRRRARRRACWPTGNRRAATPSSWSVSADRQRRRRRRAAAASPRSMRNRKSGETRMRLERRRPALRRTSSPRASAPRHERDERIRGPPASPAGGRRAAPARVRIVRGQAAPCGRREVAAGVERARLSREAAPTGVVRPADVDARRRARR